MLEKNARRKVAILSAAAAMSAGFGFMQNQAKAQNTPTQQYFDVNGTTAGFGLVNGSTYSWDNPLWASTSGGLSATALYHQDPTDTTTSFPRITGTTSGDTYTLNIGTTEYMAGMFLDPGSASGFGVTLIVNQASGTTGNLNIPSGTLEGFLSNRSGDNLVINAPITGTGGVEQQQSGQVSLFGNNTFSGGFETTGGQVTNFNTVNSFGSGTISFSGSSGQGMVYTGTPGVVYNNVIDFPSPNSTTNFVSGSGPGGTPGVTFAGPVSTDMAGTTFLESGTATSVTLFSGPISGFGLIKIGNPGTIIFTGTNTYTGGTDLAAGELIISDEVNIGGPGTELDFDGGILGISGNTLTNMDSHTTTGFTFNGGFDVQSATNTFTVNQDLSGTGTMTKLGSGTLVLTGNNSYSTTVLKAGKLVLRGDNARNPVFNNNGAVINGGQLIFDYSTGTNPASLVQSALTAGYGQTPAFSTGALRTSATADAHKGLGWVDNGSTVTVMYTYFGDANLDGKVNALDFNAVATNFGKTPGSDVWAQGDFNYDGNVNTLDFTALAGSFGLPTLSAPALSPALGTLVPEPTALALLAIGSAAMSTRRRRR